jgi:hypothetical protein
MPPSFDTTITQWIDFLDQYTIEQLLQEPEPAHWSLGQVYIHLQDNIRWQLDQAKRSLSSEQNKDVEMSEEAKVMFARGSFPDKQIQGPFTGKFIRQPESVEALRTAFIRMKDEARALGLEPSGAGLAIEPPGTSPAIEPPGTSPSIEPSGVGKAKHPGLGYFNAQEWMQFAEMHMRHHFHQKRRIDEALSRNERC